MAYITSRGYGLAVSGKEMERGTWYNMWKRKQWPYKELLDGDLVYWYDRPSERIVWKSRLKRIERFPYRNKENAARRIEKTLGRVSRSERYYKTGPRRGYCFAYKVLALKRTNLPRPSGIAFSRLGWQRVTGRIAQEWLRAW